MLIMDVINKFYSSVQVTVSQLSGVLPGNNVTREYEVLHQVANAGIGLHWKVYKGFKKTTKQEVSVFVFEKKIVEKWSKDDRESLLNLLRRGVQQLTKVKHPRILTVQHPLEESRDSLAFATEPVIASLSNILEDTSHTKLYDVEIIHGFQQLIDGLLFLHSDANIIHGNLSPDSVLINKQRSWKIFGLDFAAIKNSEYDNLGRFQMSNPLTCPSLDYLAPEKFTSETNIPESDLYSLGMLMYCICTGKPIIQFNNNHHTFKQFAQQSNQLKCQNIDKVPQDLRNIVKNMLHRNPSCRPKLTELNQLQTFRDIGVKTLNYLDTLYQWDNLQKSKFFKSLLQIIPNLPHRVVVCTVIPHLVNEFTNLPMVPFVLPNVLLVAKMSTQEEYIDHILPQLKLVFGIEEPIQVLLILMQGMDVLLKLTPPDQVKLHVLPLLNRSLESDLTELQELCLQILPSVSSLVDYNAITNSLLPKVKQLCIKSADISIKVKCLICIGNLLSHLDKWVLSTDILPFLEHIQNREPAVIMAIIGIHRIALTDPKLGITAEVMATRCIPFLTPLCMENSLSVAQFTSITTIIKEMFQKIEKEQRTKLENLTTINRDFRNPGNQKTDLLPLPNSTQLASSIWTAEKQIFKSENEAGNVVEATSPANPFVLNRQLMTPTLKSHNAATENCTFVNPPINYIYHSHNKISESLNNVNIFPSENDTKKNSENSALIPLTNQDILNFLK